MYSADQIVDESLREKSLDKHAKLVRFELPPLPLRLKKPTISDSTPTGEKFIDQGDEINVVNSRGLACISPVPLSTMELNNVLLGQPLQSNMLTKQDVKTKSGMLRTEDTSLQSSSELPVRSKRRNHHENEIRFSDIIGHASVKLRIDELILPLGLPTFIAESVLKGIRSVPASILLYGPPGCGKVG